MKGELAIRQTCFASQSRKAAVGGFTLIEVMVVVIILGILAAIVVPRLTGRTEEAKKVKAEVDIKNIEAALELFNLDNGFYPSTEQGLEALIEKPLTGLIPENWNEGGYLKKTPLDPWRRPYQYLSPGEHGEYDLFSMGADRELGGDGKNSDIKSWEL